MFMLYVFIIECFLFCVNRKEKIFIKRRFKVDFKEN